MSSEILTMLRADTKKDIDVDLGQRISVMSPIQNTNNSLRAADTG